VLEEKRGNLVGWALSLMNLSEVAYARWDMERALQISLDAMKIIEQTDNLHLQAQFSANIAVHMVAIFQFDEAAPIYEQAIEKLTQIGDEIYLAEVRFNYALLCRILKKYTLGRELAVQSLQVFEQVGMKPEAKKARDLLQKYEAYD
jgi:tetratricopeptide (TPR) repeat protein